MATWVVTIDLQQGGGVQNVSSLVRETGFRRTQTLHKRYKPVQDKCKVTLDFDSQLANDLLTAPTTQVLVVVTKDAAPWFKGASRPLSDITVSEADNTIRLDVTDYSYLLKSKYAAAKNYNGKKVCDPADTANSIVHQVLLDAGYLLADIGTVPTITQAILSMGVEQDKTTYWKIIETLLYDYGYVFHWDEDGKFQAYEWIKDSITPTGSVDHSSFVNKITLKLADDDFDTIALTYNGQGVTAKKVVGYWPSGGGLPTGGDWPPPTGTFSIHYSDAAITDDPDLQVVGTEDHELRVYAWAWGKSSAAPGPVLGPFYWSQWNDTTDTMDWTLPLYDIVTTTGIGVDWGAGTPAVFQLTWTVLNFEQDRAEMAVSSTGSGTSGLLIMGIRLIIEVWAKTQFKEDNIELRVATADAIGKTKKYTATYVYGTTDGERLAQGILRTYEFGYIRYRWRGKIEDGLTLGQYVTLVEPQTGVNTTVRIIDRSEEPRTPHVQYEAEGVAAVGTWSGVVDSSLSSPVNSMLDSLATAGPFPFVEDTDIPGTYLAPPIVGTALSGYNDTVQTGGWPDGLYFTSDYLGFIENAVWTVVIRDDGTFLFQGDVDNYIEWDGATLHVEGDLFLSGASELQGLVTTGAGIQSSNFLTGLAGWRINGAGDAEFNDVLVRGDLVATVDSLMQGTVEAGTSLFSQGYVAEVSGWGLAGSGFASFNEGLGALGVAAIGIAIPVPGDPVTAWTTYSIFSFDDGGTDDHLAANPWDKDSAELEAGIFSISMAAGALFDNDALTFATGGSDWSISWRVKAPATGNPTDGPQGRWNPWTTNRVMVLVDDWVTSAAPTPWTFRSATYAGANINDQVTITTGLSQGSGAQFVYDQSLGGRILRKQITYGAGTITWSTQATLISTTTTVGPFLCAAGADPDVDRFAWCHYRHSDTTLQAWLYQSPTTSWGNLTVQNTETPTAVDICHAGGPWWLVAYAVQGTGIRIYRIQAASNYQSWTGSTLLATISATTGTFNRVQIESLDGLNFVVGWKEATSAEMNLQKFTAAGDDFSSYTAGRSASFTDATQQVFSIMGYKGGSFYVSYVRNSDTKGVARKIDDPGTGADLTVGDAFLLSGGTNVTHCKIISLANGRVGIAYTGGTVIYYMIATIDPETDVWTIHTRTSNLLAAGTLEPPSLLRFPSGGFGVASTTTAQCGAGYIHRGVQGIVLQDYRQWVSGGTYTDNTAAYYLSEATNLAVDIGTPHVTPAAGTLVSLELDVSTSIFTWRWGATSHVYDASTTLVSQAGIGLFIQRDGPVKIYLDDLLKVTSELVTSTDLTDHNTAALPWTTAAGPFPDPADLNLYPGSGGVVKIHGDIEADNFLLPKGYLYGLESKTNSTDQLNDIDFAAGEAVDSTGAVLMVLDTALVKRADAAFAVGTNAGAMFTGTYALETTYHVFLIKRDSDGVVDIGYDTSLIAANRPSGWTYYRRIMSFRTAGETTVQTYPWTQRGREFLFWDMRRTYAGLSSTTAANRTISGIPTDIRVGAMIKADVQAVRSTTHFLCYSPDREGTDPTPSTNLFDMKGVPPLNTGIEQSIDKIIRTNTSGQLRAVADVVGNGSTTGAVDSYYVKGWIDNLELD